MKRRNFLRALLFAPFAKPVIAAVVQNLSKPAKQVSAVLGFKGRSYLDGGFIYAPYIPLYQTCLLYDKNGKHNEIDYYRSQRIETYAKQLQHRLDSGRFIVYHDPITTF